MISQPLARFAAVILAVLLLTAGTLFMPAAAAPPTVDPTYGLPPQPSPKKLTPLPGVWVWASRTADKQTVFLRCAFTLRTVPKIAALFVTADNSFAAYVNGQKVGRTVPDPAGLAWRHVQRLDIRRALTPGRNVIAIQASNDSGAAGVLASAAAGNAPLLMAGSAWKVWDAPAPSGWNTALFDDTLWQAASVKAALTGAPWGSTGGGLIGWPGLDANATYLRHLALRPAHVLNVHPGAGAIRGADTLPLSNAATLTVTLPPPGSTEQTDLVLDFGKELTGRVLLTSPTGGTVEVGTGESEDEAVRSPWTMASRGKTQVLQMHPRQTVGSEYTGFRYAHLVFPASQLGSTSLTLHVCADHLYYPVQYKGSFDCADPLLTKIWYTGAYTAHSCMQQDIWDAPKRDRVRWSGDLQVSGEAISTVFGDTFLMEQTLSKLRQDAQQGAPDTQPPADDINSIPGYSVAWVCTLADFYRHSGDLAYVKSQHDALVSLLAYVRSNAGNTPIFANKQKKWMFTDWSDNFSPDPRLNADHSRVNETTHLFLTRAAREASFLMREMGDTAHAAQYAAWANDLTRRARAAIAPAPTSTYSDRLQENAMAIYSGTATPTQQAAIWDGVLKPGSKSWNQLPTPYYNNYVIFAMSLSGHTEAALQFVRQFWGGMLAEGATTFWEGYNPRWNKEHFHEHLQADDQTGFFISLCHGWSSGPTSFLTERVLGIRPTGAGYKTAVFEPDLGDLRWAQGDIPTPRGTLRARAERQNGRRLTLRITLPSGIALTVAVPGTSAALNGRTVNAKAGERTVNLVLSKAGTYQITGN